MSKITTTISTNNNLEYLKLALKSIRQNAHYNYMPIIVHAENCDDGTDEWLKLNEYNVEYHIDHNDNPKGIGGGMNFCVDKVKTEFVNIIHSDMWIAPDQDIELLKLYDDLESDKRLIASSFRIQPKIFPNDQNLEIKKYVIFLLTLPSPGRSYSHITANEKCCCCDFFEIGHQPDVALI